MKNTDHKLNIPSYRDGRSAGLNAAIMADQGHYRLGWWFRGVIAGICYWRKTPRHERLKQLERDGEPGG